MNVNGDPRFAAYKAVTAVEEKGAYLNIVIPEVTYGAGLKASDKALCAVIAKGVIERKRALDLAVRSLSSFPVEKTDKRILRLLYMGLYQILYLDRIPPFAACNETVKIGAMFCGKKAVGFLNGVLRNAVRKKEELKKLIDAAPPAVRYSVSDDVFRMFSVQYGEETALKILASFYDPRPLCLRVNTLKTSTEELTDLLKQKEISFTVEEKNGIAVRGGGDAVIEMMKSGGAFYIQGFSSQAAVRELGAEENDTVIDMCACPGGKSFGAAIDMNNKGKVISFDVHEHKLKLINETAARLGIDVIEAHVSDSTVHAAVYENTADKVICDVPCSGTGSIGKRPEIRYKTASELDALTDTQYAILKNGVSYLKPGGKLVYSVCSLNKNEGSSIIGRYLGENNDVELTGERTVLPDRDGYDGFYIAVMRRKN